MKMRIAIIDDEDYWRYETKKIVETYYSGEDIEIDIFDNGTDFLNEAGEYDLSIVDVEMPEVDGFETIKRAKENGRESIFIILTTHTELSRNGYLVNAFRYVDKANINEEIYEALQSSSNILEKNQYIEINVGGEGKKNIILNNIYYIETEKHCTLLHTKQGILKSNYTMSQMEEMLVGKWFYRCHNSYIVNLDEIDRCEGTIIYIKNGSDIDISKRKVSEFNDLYFERKFNCANR